MALDKLAVMNAISGIGQGYLAVQGRRKAEAEKAREVERRQRLIDQEFAYKSGQDRLAREQRNAEFEYRKEADRKNSEEKEADRASRATEAAENRKLKEDELKALVQRHKELAEWRQQEAYNKGKKDLLTLQEKATKAQLDNTESGLRLKLQETDIEKTRIEEKIKAIENDTDPNSDWNNDPSYKSKTLSDLKASLTGLNNALDTGNMQLVKFKQSRLELPNGNLTDIVKHTTRVLEKESLGISTSPNASTMVPGIGADLTMSDKKSQESNRKSDFSAEQKRNDLGLSYDQNVGKPRPIDSVFSGNIDENWMQKGDTFSKTKKVDPRGYPDGVSNLPIDLGSRFDKILGMLQSR